MANQYNSYYLYEQYENRNNQGWIPVYPNVFSVDGGGTMPVSAKTLNDISCGYSGETTQDYLTFKAIESGTFKFIGSSGNTSISYSLDDGNTWNTLASDTNSPTVSAGSKIMWKGNLIPYQGIEQGVHYGDGVGTFSSTGMFSIEGNIMSLLFNDNFTSQTSLEGYDEAFVTLFSGCTRLTSAENLVLPATTLSNYCYWGMFTDCINLTATPALPAITLAEYCYVNMFLHCRSLTSAPSLPAMTMATMCYAGMFEGCTSLTSAPSLPATTLAVNCYELMFDGCTSLTTAPSLPATALSEYCYTRMFEGCTSLTSAPSLPATTLAIFCYQGMFAGCTSLTTAPVLSATTLTIFCYEMMFYNCTRLNYIKCIATDISAVGCTNSWVDGVASSGTFVKATNMASWTTGVNGIPSNWTVQND